MSQLWTEIALWWMRLAFAGGALLLAGWLLVAACRQPVRRLRLSSWTMAVCLLLLPLTLLPGWVTVPAPWTAADTAAASPTAALVATETARSSRPALIDHPALPALAEVAPDEALESLQPTERDAGPAPAATESVPAEADKATSNAVAETAVPATAAVPTPESAAPKFEPWIAKVLLLAYAAIVFLLLARLLIGQVQLERIWRSGHPAPLPVRECFRQMTRRFRCQPTLRVSNRVAGPICFGLLRPRVVLPAGLAQVADERTLRWIFAHELSHLERRDPLAGYVIGFAQSLFFFWPWFWKLRREVRLNQEYLADASAVNLSRSTEDQLPAVDYAEFLVRLTGAGNLPVSAAGVKSPSSDLYRRITMLLQKSGNVESTCSRRWSLAAGFGLLSLGLILAGFHLSAKADPAPENKAEPPKKETVEDIEKEVQKALESLKKGPAAEPRKDEDKKDEKNPGARDNAAEVRKAQDVMLRARQAMTENPTPENRRAFSEAVRNYQEAVRNNMPRFGQQFPGFAPINPPDAGQEFEQMQRMIEEMQRQMLQAPGGRGFMIGDPRALGRFGANLRLGVRLQKPAAVLVDQLDLPANKGMVVTEVQPESAAAKAGIKANDILLEIGGKAVPSDAMELQNMMRDVKNDQKVDIVLLRKGKKETIKEVAIPAGIREVELRNVPILPRLRSPNPDNPGFPPEAFGGGTNVRQSIQFSNGEFTIKRSEDGMSITIVGAKDDGGAKATSITVDDNGKSIKADSIEKLDPQYRPMVEKLLKSIR